MTTAKLAIWVCKDCNIDVGLSINNVNRHLKSAAHKKKQTVNNWSCDDCDRTMQSNGQNIVAHINGLKHQTKVRLNKEINDDKFPQASSLRTEKQEWTVGSPSVRIKYIQTDHELQKAVQGDQFFMRNETENKANNAIAITCVGAPECLSLLQIATHTDIYIFDCVMLQPQVVLSHLNFIFESPQVTKVFYALHDDAVALHHCDAMQQMEAVMDCQLVAEYLWQHPMIRLNDMLLRLEGLQLHSSKFRRMETLHNGPDIWKKRPLDKDKIEFSAGYTLSILQAYNHLKETRERNVPWNNISLASLARLKSTVDNGGKRTVCFDVDHGYRMASMELMSVLRPNAIFYNEPITCESEVDEIIKLLPQDLTQKLLKKDQSTPTPIAKYGLSDIVLDIGRRPSCWVDKDRIMLSDDKERVVDKTEVNSIIDNIGGFGEDNRAGIEQKLHRISCMRDRKQEVVGLTIRVGRWFRGNTAMLADILLGSEKSVLILGIPGSGKTTIVREAVRVLAETNNNVCVVDTSNEIGGDGAVPHPCIGLARRMMVPSLDAQSKVMVECVQNHTPHVMVIDEVGRTREVEAARTVKQRGVRIIASAHGDLRSLIKNKDLRGLVGSIETVTLGDAAAKEEATRKASKGIPIQGISKTKTQRMGEPTFDVIVEVTRGKFHEWNIVKDTGKAVDAILDGSNYDVERRSRNPSQKDITIEITTG